jgi:hypothetical protein
MNSKDFDIIKKFKKLLVKEVSNKKTTRKSFGKHYNTFLYCFTENNNYYSRILTKGSPVFIQLLFDNKKLFKDSLFEGEYYKGVFYITRVIYSVLTRPSEDIEVMGLDNLKILNDSNNQECGYEYIFNHATFEEKYKEIESSLKKNIVKDNNFIEIYRIKETNEIIRVKNISTSKKLSNLFYNRNDSIEMPVIFNEVFQKYEILDPALI